MQAAITQATFINRPLPLYPILLAHQCVMLPLYFFVPFWVVLLNLCCIGTAVWSQRCQAFRIPRWLKIGVTCLAFAGILFGFHRFSGRDAGVALISVMYGLKLLELKTRRDANLLLSMGFFMLVAGFLFSQSPLIAFYQLLPVLAILNALVAMQSIGQTQAIKEAQVNLLSIGQIFKEHFRYLLLALPIMLILFVFFPRLSGPLWRMPGASSAASGVSDTMSPGAISSLQLVDKVAMRVEFNAKAPEPHQMYWRLLVLDRFDGFSWTRAGTTPIDDPASLPAAVSQFRYTVTLEATRQNFLATLDRPVQTPQQGQLLRDFVTYSAYRLLDRTRYQVVSSPDLRLEPGLGEARKMRFTQLPGRGNKRSNNWAKQQRQMFNSDWDYILHLLSQINQRDYYYSLSPPIMDEDTIDSFWFDHKKGFCEHYAGAFVYLARAANIPARVVVGYQGGEKNPLSDYWIVRYANAHAWTEVWIAGQGWVRVDPTAAIAPHRVEQSLLADYRQRDRLFDEIDFVELGAIGALKHLEYWLDQFNNRWNKWVLDYNNQSQRYLFENIGLSHLSSKQIIVVMFSLVFIFVFITSLKWFHQQDRQDPLEKAFVLFQKKLDKKGLLAFDPAIGPVEMKQRIKQQAFRSAPIIQLLNAYIRLRYGQEKPEAAEVKALIKRFTKLSIRAK